MPSADCFLQIRHLHRSERSLETLVAHLQAGAIDCLLERVAGENTKCMWHSGFLRRLPNPTRDFVDDHVVVRRISAEQASEADYGVVFSGFGESARSGGNFEGAGNAD